MKRQIPNIITLLNLFCGILAIIALMDDHIPMAALWVSLGIFFDFFDGLAARLLKVSSPLGLQLDSLADMVTSGVVPGMAMFYMLQNSVAGSSAVWATYLPYFGLCITLASAYRLAKFNIDERQSDSFIGLPTPANTLFILSLALIPILQPVEIVVNSLLNPWVLIGLTIFSCYFLNSDVSLPSLKFKSFAFRDNKIRYLLIGLCVLLVVTLRVLAIPIIIIGYLMLSIFKKEERKK